MKHEHKSRSHNEVPFSGPVAKHQYPPAHGAICRIDYCECGATQKTNRNGAFFEQGEWTDPNDLTVTNPQGDPDAIRDALEAFVAGYAPIDEGDLDWELLSVAYEKALKALGTTHEERMDSWKDPSESPDFRDLDTK